MDIEHDEYWCGGADCTCDYIEILGERYCGTSLPDPIISCYDLKVTFKSDNIADGRWKSFSGFRAVWTEIPDDR